MKFRMMDEMRKMCEEESSTKDAEETVEGYAAAEDDDADNDAGCTVGNDCAETPWNGSESRRRNRDHQCFLRPCLHDDDEVEDDVGYDHGAD